MKVWIVTGKSESGDDYGPWVFKNKPTDKQLELILRSDHDYEFPDAEDGDGPGSFGSYIHLDEAVEREVL